MYPCIMIDFGVLKLYSWVRHLEFPVSNSTFQSLQCNRILVLINPYMRRTCLRPFCNDNSVESRGADVEKFNFACIEIVPDGIKNALVICGAHMSSNVTIIFTKNCPFQISQHTNHESVEISSINLFCTPKFHTFISIFIHLFYLEGYKKQKKCFLSWVVYSKNLNSTRIKPN